MPLPEPAKRLLINIFLMFHIFAISVWALPYNTSFLFKTRQTIAPYMQWSGLIQGWKLYAPDPQSMNAFVTAEIIYRDGQKKIYKLPMPQDYGYYRRYFMDRRSMWAIDNLRLNVNSILWPDAARYIARLNSSPENPPTSITLVRHWSYIQPPNSGRTETWSEEAFFKYSVQPGDLL